MARTYAKLRALMMQNDDTQNDLARLMLVSPQAISNRMNNRSDWKLSEMYAIMNRYHVPHEQLHEVFPEGGKKVS